MTTKSKKEKPRFLQTMNPRTKSWVKIDSKTGKIISTKKTPGKYKGIKVAKLAKPSAKAAMPVKGNDNGRVKKAAQNAKRAVSSPKKKTVAKPRIKISEQTKAEIASAKARIATLEGNHLAQVLAHTGKILPEDRKYCKSLGKRMLEKQFPILKK